MWSAVPNRTPARSGPPPRPPRTGSWTDLKRKRKFQRLAGQQLQPGSHEAFETGFGNCDLIQANRRGGESESAFPVAPGFGLHAGERIAAADLRVLNYAAAGVHDGSAETATRLRQRRQGVEQNQKREELPHQTHYRKNSGCSGLIRLGETGAPLERLVTRPRASRTASGIHAIRAPLHPSRGETSRWPVRTPVCDPPYRRSEEH